MSVVSWSTVFAEKAWLVQFSVIELWFDILLIMDPTVNFTLSAFSTVIFDFNEFVLMVVMFSFLFTWTPFRWDWNWGHFGRFSDLSVMSVRSVFFVFDWDWDSSDNFYWSSDCAQNWDISLLFFLFKYWVLNMMNIVLIVVLLNIRLSDVLFSWNLNSGSSVNIIDLSIFINVVQLNFFSLSLINSQINILSINNRLDQSLIVDISSRSLYSLNSFWVSDDWSLSNLVQIDNFILFFDEIQFFSLVNNLSTQNWLIDNFSSWSIVVFSLDLFRVFNRSGNNSVIVDSGISLIDVENFFLEILNRLNISLSVSFFSWYSNGDILSEVLSINNGGSIFSFGYNRSADLFLSDNWSLHNLLSDDRLSDSSSGDNWLFNNGSSDFRLRNDFLRLSDGRSRVENVSIVSINRSFNLFL